MARPGFVLEVDERTPRPARCTTGEGFRLEQFPLRSARVIYPPESTARAPGRRRLHPPGAADHPTRLAGRFAAACTWPGMKLTIVFDDALAPASAYAARRTSASASSSRSLELAAAKGVDRRRS